MSRSLFKECVTKKKSYFSTETNVVGTQKNRLNKSLTFVQEKKLNQLNKHFLSNMLPKGITQCFYPYPVNNFCPAFMSAAYIPIAEPEH